MSHKSEIVTTAGTICCALVIGFFMQTGETADLRYGGLSPATSPEDLGADETDVQSKAAMQVASITLTSAGPDTLIGHNAADLLMQASLESAGETPMPENQRVATAGCDVAVSATAQPAATLALLVTAPCLTGERLTVQHDALTFTDVIPQTGELGLTLPALSEAAAITVAFDTGHRVEATAQVSDWADYNRYLLHWRGAEELKIESHAETGGELFSLGAENLPDPRQALVYSYALDQGARSSEGAVSIKAEVTAENCEKDLQAQAIEFRAGKLLARQELTLSMPGCAYIGQFLVLNNPLQNLTVAAR